MMNFPSEAEKKQWRYEDFVQATSAEYMLRQLAEECCESKWHRFKDRVLKP